MLLLWAILVSDPSLPRELRLDVEARRVVPKFRVRDGEPSLKGTSFYSEDYDGDEPAPGIAAELSYRFADEIFHAGGWAVDVDGKGQVPQDEAWGGAIVPAGTFTEVEYLTRQVEAGYRHRFRILPDRLWADLGVDLEYLTFSAQFDFGTTRLRGLYWTPQALLAWEPAQGVQLRARIGGLEVATVKGKHAVLEPMEAGAAVRVRLDRLHVELGWALTHVHLEENMGDVHEDIVHMRLRFGHLGLSWRF